ncbi:hypothetical protein VTG60DRAFT_3551 [Thermothelomyces hinnuleus]
MAMKYMSGDGRWESGRGHDGEKGSGFQGHHNLKQGREKPTGAEDGFVLSGTSDSVEAAQTGACFSLLHDGSGEEKWFDTPSSISVYIFSWIRQLHKRTSHLLQDLFFFFWSTSSNARFSTPLRTTLWNGINVLDPFSFAEPCLLSPSSFFFFFKTQVTESKFGAHGKRKRG